MKVKSPMAGRARESSTSTGHRAANRVVDILELLAASRDGLALREVSAQLEAPKSSLLPLLRALTARGYLEQTRRRRVPAGPGRARAGRRRRPSASWPTSRGRRWSS